MTWFRVDDTLGAHQKPRKAGLAAMGLWVLSGAHCSQQLTDGFVPAWYVDTFRSGRKHAADLVSAGLWMVFTRDGEDGWLFHDWEQANPTREKVLAEREKTRKRQQEWRERPRDTSRSHSVRNGVTDTVTNASPTRPDPTRKEETPVGVSPRKRATPRTGPPDDMLITPEMAAWGRENAPLVRDPRMETTRFLDHARANGKVFADWAAAWRTWMGNAQKYAARDGVAPTTGPSSNPATAWAREQG